MTPDAEALFITLWTQGLDTATMAQRMGIAEARGRGGYAMRWWEVAWPLLGIGLAVLLWVADPPGKSWILPFAIGIGVVSVVYFVRSFRSH